MPFQFKQPIALTDKNLILSIRMTIVKHLVPFVQKVDSTIHWLTQLDLLMPIHWTAIYQAPVVQKFHSATTGLITIKQITH